MIIYGASGHGLVIADILECSGVKKIHFWDDQIRPDFPYPVSSPDEALLAGKDMLLAIGNNATRSILAHRYPEYAFATAIHPSAVLSSHMELGSGTVVMAGVIVNPFARIRQHVILNTGCHIDHECLLGDFVHISPGAILAGNVTVGEGSWIGAGAVIKQGIRIGTHSIIGVGSVVLQDVPDNTVVVGNPAKVLRTENA